MEKQKVLVLEKTLLCNECDQEFHGYTEAPPEGFGYEAQLYECGSCNTVFSHSIEDEIYGGKLDDQIANLSCPSCKKLLNSELRKREIVGVCSNCGKRNYTDQNQSKEQYIETYQLYR